MSKKKKKVLLTSEEIAVSLQGLDLLQELVKKKCNKEDIPELTQTLEKLKSKFIDAELEVVPRGKIVSNTRMLQ